MNNINKNKDKSPRDIKRNATSQAQHRILKVKLENLHFQLSSPEYF